jgi:hypothetical protein
VIISLNGVNLLICNGDASCFFVVGVTFLDHRENVELVPKFHVPLHASHAALPIIISKFRSKVAYLMLR